MFFELSSHPNKSFPCSWKIGGRILSTDVGWQEFQSGNKRAIAKGYTFEVPLEQAAFEPPQYRGMFCSIAETEEGVMITHGLLRGFPVYKTATGISNFDVGLKIPPNKFYKNNRYVEFDNLPKNLILPQNLDEALSLIDSYLEENLRGFVKHDSRKIEVTVTGGLDTTLVYSYIESLAIPHTPVIDKIREFDEFFINIQKSDRFNGWINDVNHYRDPCVVTAGGNGDLFFLRQDWVMPWIDSNQRYVYSESDYADLTIPENNTQYSAPRDREGILSGLLTCSHIWHIGNTIYLNPLLDMRIPMTLMELDKDVLYEAARTGQVQRELIAKRSPWMAQLLPAKKNQNSRLNFLPEILKRLDKTSNL